MPLVRISLRKGKPPEYKQSICRCIYKAMLEEFNVPEHDQFMVIHEHDADNFIFSANYLDIQRTEDLLIIQITANNTRTIEQKKAFYAGIAKRLTESISIRPEDILINLLEVTKENWSFGNGIAQYL